MKFVARWLFRLLVLALLLAVALLLLKDTLIREVAEARIRRKTGLEVHIGELNLALLSPTLTVRDLRLYNPPEFGGSLFLDVPELHVEYDRDAFSSRRLHLRLVRLNLAELHVVENQFGKSNLEAMDRRVKDRPDSGAGAKLEFAGIDTLNLSLGRIRFSRLGEPGRTQTWNLDVQNEVLTRLNSVMDASLALGQLAVKLGMRELSEHLSIKPPRPPPAPVPPAGRPPPAVRPAPTPSR